MNPRRDRISKLLTSNFSLHELFKILLNKKNLLTDANLELLEKSVQKFEGKGVSKSDLMDIGTIGLLKAIQRFDENQGQSLESYAEECIGREVQEFFQQELAE